MRTEDFWNTLQEIDTALRKIITITMSTAYGGEWVQKLEKQHPNLKKVFDNGRQQQRRAE